MKYTNDFRKDAVKYVDEHPELTIKEVAGYLGIPKDTLYGWTRTEARNRLFGEGNTANAGPMSETEKELARLKRENRDLEDALIVLKKSHQHSGRLTESIYATTYEIANSDSGHRISVSGVLKHLGVSKSGYYDWINRKPSNRSIKKQEVMENIKDIYDDSYCIYGAPKITDELHKRGFNSKRLI